MALFKQHIILIAASILGTANHLSFGQTVDVNRIFFSLTPYGTLGENASSYSGQGAVWQEWESGYSENNIVYDHGLWITGKRNGGYGCVPSLWQSSFSAGPIINGQPGGIVNPQEAWRYRVYCITAGDTPAMNPDIDEWPADLGAPLDSSGQPKLLGDQTAWTVFNGADTTLYPYFFRNRSLSPRALLPVEVRETVFEHFGEPSDTTVWANAVFFEWGIYNKGPDPLDSVFLSFWSDLDFINVFRTLPGIDTSSQTGYCWYGDDSTYGSVGYSLLYGPAIPSAGDTAVFFGKKKAGYKNNSLSSFWPIFDDSYSDGNPRTAPYSIKSAWNVVRGLNPDGSPIIDSITRQPTKFPYSGDPVTGQGSVYPLRYTGGGAGMMMTTGPLSMAAGDSQWIMIALLPSVKLNGVDAINRMRTTAAYLRNLPYDSLTSRKPRREVPIHPLPVFTPIHAFTLHRNYPNPFNAGTVIPFDLPEDSYVSIRIFDTLGRFVTSLSNQFFQKGERSIRWFPTVSSGVYFIRIDASSVESPTAWNGTNKVILLR